MAFTAEADLFGTPRVRRSEKQESKQVNKSSAKERLERLFADKGIVGLKLGTTLVVHECLGVVIMAGTWGE